MATSKITKELIVEKKYAPAITVNPNGYASFDINVSKNGYIPIGVLELYKDGSASGYCAISNYFFNANKTTLTIGVANTSAYTASVGLRVTVLYQRVGGVVRNILKALQSLTFRTERGWA